MIFSYIATIKKQMTTQTKKQSFLEAIANTGVGFLISFSSTFLIFPLMEFESSPGENLTITLFFSSVSIARGYLLRRIFN